MIDVGLALLFAAAPIEARPLSLDDAWSLAWHHNAQVQVVKAEKARAETLVHQAHALFLPVVEARSAMQWNDERKAFAAGPTEFVLQPWWTFQWQVTASQNLSFFGPALPLLRQARSIVEAADQGVRGSDLEVAYAVAASYYAALAAESLAGVARDGTESARELARATDARAENGRATAAERLRAQVRLAESQQALAEAERAAEQAKEALADLIGVAGPYRLSRPPPPVEPAVPDDPASIRLLVNNRPDVAAARDATAAARHAWEAARRQFLPTLGLQAAYSGYTTSDGELFGQSPNRVAVLGLATIPLFDGRLRHWQARERRASWWAAKARAEIALSAADADVRRARRRLAAARETAALGKERLRLAESARLLVAEQYAVGLATQLERLDADTAIASARRAAAQGELDAELAVLDLRRALGLPLGRANGGP